MKKYDLYELWEQHKQQITMEMIEASPDEEYLHQCQTATTDIFSGSSISTKFKDILPWNISQMITKAVPINTRMIISCAMEKGIPYLL